MITTHTIQEIIVEAAKEYPGQHLFSPANHRELKARVLDMREKMKDYIFAINDWKKRVSYPDWMLKHIHFWPLLLGYALAIKLGKTTGEFLMLKNQKTGHKRLGAM